MTCDHLTPQLTARVGCDLQAVAPVAESISRAGERYLRAIFGPEEHSHLMRRRRGPAPESVAARFAAKEAVLKVLAPEADDPVPWPSITVRTLAGGAPSIALTGLAADLAERRGLSNWSLSMSHDGDYALAVALAMCPTTDPVTTTNPSSTPTDNHRKEESTMDATTESTVREVLAAHGKFPQDAHALDADADLYREGLTSHASVNVMLALEDEFDIEFPEEMLTKATFTSIRSISDAVEAVGRA